MGERRRKRTVKLAKKMVASFVITVGATAVAGCGGTSSVSKYVAIGMIHPAGGTQWCLSAFDNAQPGSTVFIAKCGRPGFQQWWTATRDVNAHSFTGSITLPGPDLALGNANENAVLVNTLDPQARYNGLVFTQKTNGLRPEWAIQIPWYHDNPLSTSSHPTGTRRYLVYWLGIDSTHWTFSAWTPIELPN
jgi:hypothetical protein